MPSQRPGGTELARALTADELSQLAESLFTPTAAAEAAVLAGCLGVAWTIVRLLRGPEAVRGSIWFGRIIVDGVLFPVLALLLALLARRALETLMPLAA